MAQPSRILSISRNLQTETIGTETLGTVVAVGPRKVIGISVDGKTQLAYGDSTDITAGPIYDSYSETNADSDVTLNSGGTVGAGQSFTGEAMANSVLASCQFYMKKTGAPTGDATAKVYASFGTDGTSAIPTGTALATSGTLDVATLTGTSALKTFTFTGANKITLRPNVVYVVTVEYSGGDGSNNVQVGYDGSAPTHAGNYSSYDGTIWTANSGRDVVFYVRVTESDVLLPAAGVYTLQIPDHVTQLVLYNPSASTSVISSVFETFNP